VPVHTVITDDLTTRLTGLTVLRPEERESVFAGRRPGGTGGLSAFLAAHPDGVVQLEDAQPISSDGLLDLFWVPVGCLGPTKQSAQQLAERVTLRLCGTNRDPGHYTRQIPDQPRRLPDDGAWLCRPTFSVTLLAGMIPG